MAQLKTQKNKKSPTAFIKSIDDPQKRKDCNELLKFFKSITKNQPKMWGDNIIGFGSYHYKSERSSQEGDWYMTGFSPIKTGLSIYIISGFSDYTDLLKKLGKHKHSVGCLYINNLNDINIPILKKIIKDCVKVMKKQYGAK